MEIGSNSNFLYWYSKVNFEDQKSSLLTPQKYLNLSFYSIVFVKSLKKTNKPLLIQETIGSYTIFAFTQKPKNEDPTIVYHEYTLGQLSLNLSTNTKTTFIKINSQSENENTINKCEEIILCPLQDQMSKQLTITSLDQTLPLIAIDDSKVRSLNFEAIYAFFRDSEMPNDREERTNLIIKMIDLLKFSLKRTPIKFGSSSVICIFLDFEDPLEENQFIQDYDLLDSYSNVIFVNSNLEIINTYRQKINYDGDKMETILLPIIEWQKNNNPIRQELL